MEQQYQIQRQVGGAGAAMPPEENKNMSYTNPTQLLDEVYIFYDKDKKGIRFFDKTPKKVAQVHPGKYQTDIPSIAEVKWNEKVNKQNSIQKVLYTNGEHTVTTIMLSPVEYFEIMDTIIKAEENGEQQILIDLEEKIKLIQLREKNMDGIYDTTALYKDGTVNHIEGIKREYKEYYKYIERTNIDTKKDELIDKLNKSEILEAVDKIKLDSNAIAKADKANEFTENEINKIGREFEDNINNITKEELTGKGE